MVKILLPLLLICVPQVFAQKEDLNARDPRLNEGSLFTVSLTPKSKKVVVSVAGQPHVELGPDRVMLFGREVLSAGKTRTLTIRPAGDGFEIVEPLDVKRTVEIDVQDKSDKKKKETFKFDSKP